MKVSLFLQGKGPRDIEENLRRSNKNRGTFLEGQEKDLCSRGTTTPI